MFKRSALYAAMAGLAVDRYVHTQSLFDRYAFDHSRPAVQVQAGKTFMVKHQADAQWLNERRRGKKPGRKR
jgi:hypothetical protein